MFMFNINGENGATMYANIQGAPFVMLAYMPSAASPIDYSTNVPTIQYAALASNYGTTSTTPVSTGMGVSIPATKARTPMNPYIFLNNTDANFAIKESSFRVKLVCYASNGTLTDGTTISVYRNVTGVVAQGTGPGGDTSVWSETITQESLASNPYLFAADFLDTGLTYSSAPTYSYYVCINAVTAGTATAVASKQTTIYVEAV